MKHLLLSLLAFVGLGLASAAQAVVIIDDTTGGWYNAGIGDLADLYGPDQFPAANSSEGDPVIPNAAEPTLFSAAFGTDWLAGDYSGGSWGMVGDVPNSWAVNTETAIVYEFNLAGLSDLHIDLGVDNGVYVWLDGNYLFGALAPGGSNLNEYDIDLMAVGAGDHRLQILREDHGGATGFNILVNVEPSQYREVPAPSTLALFGVMLLGLRRRLWG